MEKEMKKACFGFSWADEVEREEQEEGKEAEGEFLKQENPNRKPNPFGDARPREVVLQEKGVDWRKLDEKLDYPSNLRDEKKLKENIPATTASISRQEPFPLRLRFPERNESETNKARKICDHPMTHSRTTETNSSIYVPPLKYPPKNIVALMEQIHRGHRSNRLDVEGPQNFHQFSHRSKFDMEKEKEHMNQKLSLGNFHVDGVSRRETTQVYNPNMNKTCHSRAHQNLEIKRERENMESECKRRKWFTERWTGVTEEMHETRGRQVLVNLNLDRNRHGENYNVGEEDYWEYIEGGNGRRNNDRQIFKVGEEDYWEYIEHGTERRRHHREVQGKLMAPPVGPPQVGWGQNHYNLNIENCNFGRNCKERGLRSATDVIERERNGGGMLVGHSRRAMLNRDAARQENCILNMDGASSVDNYNKKEEMLSAPKPGPSHQRRKGKKKSRR